MSFEHIGTIHTPQFGNKDGWVQCGERCEFGLKPVDWDLNKLRSKPSMVDANLDATIVYRRDIDAPEAVYESGYLYLLKPYSYSRLSPFALGNSEVLDVWMTENNASSLFEIYMSGKRTSRFAYDLLHAIQETYSFLDYERSEIKPLID